MKTSMEKNSNHTAKHKAIIVAIAHSILLDTLSYSTMVMFILNSFANIYVNHSLWRKIVPRSTILTASIE